METLNREAKLPVDVSSKGDDKEAPRPELFGNDDLLSLSLSSNSPMHDEEDTEDSLGAWRLPLVPSPRKPLACRGREPKALSPTGTENAPSLRQRRSPSQRTGTPLATVDFNVVQDVVPEAQRRGGSKHVSHRASRRASVALDKSFFAAAEPLLLDDEDMLSPKDLEQESGWPGHREEKPLLNFRTEVAAANAAASHDGAPPVLASMPPPAALPASPVAQPLTPSNEGRRFQRPVESQDIEAFAYVSGLTPLPPLPALIGLDASPAGGRPEDAVTTGTASGKSEPKRLHSSSGPQAQAPAGFQSPQSLALRKMRLEKDASPGQDPGPASPLVKSAQPTSLRGAPLQRSELYKRRDPFLQRKEKASLVDAAIQKGTRLKLPGSFSAPPSPASPRQLAAGKGSPRLAAPPAEPPAATDPSDPKQSSRYKLQLEQYRETARRATVAQSAPLGGAPPLSARHAPPLSGGSPDACHDARRSAGRSPSAMATPLAGSYLREPPPPGGGSSPQQPQRTALPPSPASPGSVTAASRRTVCGAAARGVQRAAPAAVEPAGGNGVAAPVAPALPPPTKSRIPRAAVVGSRARPMKRTSPKALPKRQQAAAAMAAAALDAGSAGSLEGAVSELLPPSGAAGPARFQSRIPAPKSMAARAPSSSRGGAAAAAASKAGSSGLRLPAPKLRLSGQARQRTGCATGIPPPPGAASAHLRAPAVAAAAACRTPSEGEWELAPGHGAEGIPPAGAASPCSTGLSLQSCSSTPWAQGGAAEAQVLADGCTPPASPRARKGSAGLPCELISYSPVSCSTGPGTPSSAGSSRYVYAAAQPADASPPPPPLSTSDWQQEDEATPGCTMPPDGAVVARAHLEHCLTSPLLVAPRHAGSPAGQQPAGVQAASPGAVLWGGSLRSPAMPSSHSRGRLFAELGGAHGSWTVGGQGSVGLGSGCRLSPSGRSTACPSAGFSASPLGSRGQDLVLQERSPGAAIALGPKGATARQVSCTASPGSGGAVREEQPTAVPEESGRELAWAVGAQEAASGVSASISRAGRIVVDTIGVPAAPPVAEHELLEVGSTLEESQLADEDDAPLLSSPTREQPGSTSGDLPQAGDEEGGNLQVPCCGTTVTTPGHKQVLLPPPGQEMVTAKELGVASSRRSLSDPGPEGVPAGLAGVPAGPGAPSLTIGTNCSSAVSPAGMAATPSRASLGPSAESPMQQTYGASAVPVPAGTGTASPPAVQQLSSPVLCSSPKLRARAGLPSAGETTARELSFCHVGAGPELDNCVGPPAGRSPPAAGSGGSSGDGRRGRRSQSAASGSSSRSESKRPPPLVLVRELRSPCSLSFSPQVQSSDNGLAHVETWLNSGAPSGVVPSVDRDRTTIVPATAATVAANHPSTVALLSPMTMRLQLMEANGEHEKKIIKLRQSPPNGTLEGPPADSWAPVPKIPPGPYDCTKRSSVTKLQG